MKQLNLPRKLVGTIQMWGSLLLILLALIMSFTPIITIETSENIVQIRDMISDVVPDADLEDVIPDEVSVSSPKLISSISMLTKIVSIAMDSAKTDMTAEEAEDLAERQAEFEEYLKSDEGKEDVATAVCIATTIVGAIDFEDTSDFFSLILKVLVCFVGLFAVLIMTLILPLLFLIPAIKAVSKALKNIQTPENVAAELGSVLPGKISLPLMIMLFQCAVPGMTYAGGVSTICILAVISVVLNFAVSRLREYPNEEFKYLNILQGPAFVGMIGFLVFFFNIIKSNVFTSFINGKFAFYLTQSAVYTAAKQDVNTSYIIDGILMVVYLVVMLGCVGYLDKAARRLSCTVRRERPKGLAGLISSGKISDNNIVMAVVTLAAYIIPTLVAGWMHYCENPLQLEGEGQGSFLVLTEAGESALAGALAGIIIMILAEVAVIVLKKVFCPDMSVEAAETLMTGHSKTSAEKLAEAQKIVADAEAKVAAAQATVAAAEAEANKTEE